MKFLSNLFFFPRLAPIEFSFRGWLLPPTRGPAAWVPQLNGIRSDARRCRESGAQHEKNQTRPLWSCQIVDRNASRSAPNAIDIWRLIRRQLAPITSTRFALVRSLRLTGTLAGRLSPVAFMVTISSSPRRHLIDHFLLLLLFFSVGRSLGFLGFFFWLCAPRVLFVALGSPGGWSVHAIHWTA